MKNLSTTFTMFLKLFLPVFFVVFFGAFLMALLFAVQIKGSVLDTSSIKIGFAIFYITWLIIIYFTIFQLKRVDADDEYLYISNYFKTFRYHISNIADYKSIKFLGLTIVTIKFRKKGYFGKKVIFIASKKRWNLFLNEEKGITQD